MKSHQEDTIDDILGELDRLSGQFRDERREKEIELQELREKISEEEKSIVNADEEEETSAALEELQAEEDTISMDIANYEYNQSNLIRAADLLRELI